MKKNIFILAFAILKMVSLAAQDNIEEKLYHTPRTLLSYPISQPDTFERLHVTLGDSIWVYEGSDDVYFVYPHGNRYKAINFDFYSDVDSIFPFDFSGDGTLEYVLFTSYSSGRSGWQSGWNVREENILVLDAERSALLLDLNVYQEHNYWENELDYNEGDSNAYPEIISSTGTYACDSKTVLIDKEDKHIYVDPTDHTKCEDTNEYNGTSMLDDNHEESDEDIEERLKRTPFILKLKAYGFIREEID
jgi:hypothetical protein